MKGVSSFKDSILLVCASALLVTTAIVITSKPAHAAANCCADVGTCTDYVLYDGCNPCNFNADGIDYVCCTNTPDNRCHSSSGGSGG